MTQDRQRQPAKEWTCTSCSHRWIDASSMCPRCGQFGKSDGAEFTKKIVELPDLLKGF